MTLSSLRPSAAFFLPALAFGSAARAGDHAPSKPIPARAAQTTNLDRINATSTWGNTAFYYRAQSWFDKRLFTDADRRRPTMWVRVVRRRWSRRRPGWSGAAKPGQGLGAGQRTTMPDATILTVSPSMLTSMS